MQKTTNVSLSFPGGSDGKDSAWNAGNMGSIPKSQEDHLEKLVTTQSRIIVSGIPWTEELDGLQYIGMKMGQTCLGE